MMHSTSHNSDNISDHVSTQIHAVVQASNKTDGIPEPMSKSRMKKLARKQRMLDIRPEKRRLEKERKKQKKLELAQKRANNELPQPIDCKPKRVLMSESTNKFRIVIDMDFEGLMTDDEIAKAAKQVNRVYALNRHSSNPCQLYISSLKGKIRDRFAITNTGYLNWDANLSECDYVDLFIPETEKNDTKLLEAARDELKKSIIYLSGDSEENLPDVEEILKDESKIFVIGGLVDHNRHKNLCLDRARDRHIRTAKLPIKDYVKLCQRHILSTVTVFEIMLNVLADHKSWRDAFIESIPSRKIAPAELSAGQNTLISQNEADKKDGAVE